MATYLVTAEVLETADEQRHAKGAVVELSDAEAQIALSQRAVRPVDPVQQYRLELAKCQARVNELTALINAGNVKPTPVAAPAPVVAPVTPTSATTPATTADTQKDTSTAPTEDGGTK